MYNKLFTKILDSSIWLAPDPHRLVWITLIAAMDQNGYAAFACAENLASRARVSVDETKAAIAAFEGPDPYAPEQEFEGRRIERVDGGWFVLNAEKYRNLVTRAVANEQAKLRMQRYRERKAIQSVTQPLRSVTPSYHIKSDHQSKTDTQKPAYEKNPLPPDWAQQLSAVYPRRSGPSGIGGTKTMLKIRAALLEDPWQTILDGAQRYADYCDKAGKTGSEFVKTAATFIEERAYREEFLFQQPRDPAEAARAERESERERNAELRGKQYGMSRLQHESVAAFETRIACASIGKRQQG